MDLYYKKTAMYASFVDSRGKGIPNQATYSYLKAV